MEGHILRTAKSLGVKHNVSIQVIDAFTQELIQSHEGHNAATNSMLLGIGHYLTGDGVLNQGYHMLSEYVPQYISLGTMGLRSQEEDEFGYPADLGDIEGSEESRYIDYMLSSPGYGADGYDDNSNNGRKWFGLGPAYKERPDPEHTVKCELVSTTFPRAQISYREIVPETHSELPQTIDVVFSALVSTNALAQFREEGKNYLFITEAGLWSRPDWIDGGDNGLLAGYRIAPPNEQQWDMHDEHNREVLKKNILRVGPNQVVQVIWKVQLGGMDQFGGIDHLYPQNWRPQWIIWD